MKKNKKLLVLTASTCVLFCLLLTAFTDKKVPAEETKAYCLENIKQFQSQLDTLQSLAEGKAARDVMLQRFKTARVSFKRFEFLVEYLDSPWYPFFNGVNAVEMDEGYNPNAKPQGLQVIETELYNDSLDYDRIVFLNKQLKYMALSFFLMLKDTPIRDTYIFEAMRFNLIRMEALGLVSFDSPKVRNNVAELRAALQTQNTIASFYNDDKYKEEVGKLQLSLQRAITYLQNKNFNSLDRLFFIKNHLQPITTDLSRLQQKLGVQNLEETSKLFRAVNLKANNIYDVNFLNAKFYAQDKYYKNNPLYKELGRKLFFDKRLSQDGSMSCGNCHQPANMFTDNMPTAITNKLGEFQKRNTPTIINAALQAAYFYDLSATSLETQVDHVMVNPHEFNCSYDEVLKRFKADTQYVRLFTEAFPEFKGEAISIFAINTCIAEFERQFIRLNSPFDQYMRGQTTTIDPSVKRGFNIFMGKAQCGSCHFAPTFFGTAPPFYGITESEVLGTTKMFDTIHPVLDDDIGRFKNMEYDPFKFAFKTSTVRNAEVTAPYMHNGGFRTLEEVIEFYDHGGGAGLGLSVPNQTLPADRLNLTKQDKKDLISFIKALTDTSGIINARFGISN